MERLSGGVVHIPIFLNTLLPGLYYAQILVCSTSRTIPYDGPTEDLDIAASYVIPATGEDIAALHSDSKLGCANMCCPDLPAFLNCWSFV